MKIEYETRNHSIDIPKNVGKEGFIRTIRKLLDLPQIQFITMKPGKILYSFLERQDYPTAPLEMDLSSLVPSSVIRNKDVTEIEEDKNAAYAVARLFHHASSEFLFPVAFVVGPDTSFWLWHEKSTGIRLDEKKEEAYGIPVLMDALIPSAALILCCGVSRESALIDVCKSFKTQMPEKYQLL